MSTQICQGEKGGILPEHALPMSLNAVQVFPIWISVSNGFAVKLILSFKVLAGQREREKQTGDQVLERTRHVCAREEGQTRDAQTMGCTSVSPMIMPHRC